MRRGEDFPIASSSEKSVVERKEDDLRESSGSGARRTINFDDVFVMQRINL